MKRYIRKDYFAMHNTDKQRSPIPSDMKTARSVERGTTLGSLAVSLEEVRIKPGNDHGGGLEGCRMFDKTWRWFLICGELG